MRAHACIDGIASTRYGDPVTRVLREKKRERKATSLSRERERERARETALGHGVSDATGTRAIKSRLTFPSSCVPWIRDHRKTIDGSQEDRGRAAEEERRKVRHVNSGRSREEEECEGASGRKKSIGDFFSLLATLDPTAIFFFL